MIEPLQALIALAEEGTMTRAALRLRVAQATVSRRIDQLEAATTLRLIEPEGRRVRLTPEGRRLVEEGRPRLAELLALLQAPALELGAPIPLAATDSLLSSEGAALLLNTAETWSLRAHRGPLCLDAVRSGAVALALLSALPDEAHDLRWEILGWEAMVVIGAPPCGPLPPLSTIEETSLSWRALLPQLPPLEATLEAPLAVSSRLGSFSALAQLALAGGPPALVPAGVARALHAEARPLPGPGLWRPISLCARPRLLDAPGVRRAWEALRAGASCRSWRPTLSGEGAEASRAPR